MLTPSLRPLLLDLALAFPAMHADAAGQAGRSLVDFSLEQLADIVVTSVSRRETRLAEAPASICIISGADIRRAGALGNGGHHRVYGQYADAADTASEAGVSARNGWHRRQAGFRADRSGSAHDVLLKLALRS